MPPSCFVAFRDPYRGVREDAPGPPIACRAASFTVGALLVCGVNQDTERMIITDLAGIHLLVIRAAMFNCSTVHLVMVIALVILRYPPPISPTDTLEPYVLCFIIIWNTSSCNFYIEVMLLVIPKSLK